MRAGDVQASKGFMKQGIGHIAQIAILHAQIQM